MAHARSLMTLAVVATLSLGALAALHGHADQPTPPSVKLASKPFGGKIMLVLLRDEDVKRLPAAVALKDMQVQSVAGQPVLTGIAVYLGDGAGRLFKGRRLWVPFSRVLQFTEFESLAELKKALAEESRDE